MGEALQTNHPRTRAGSEALFPPELFAAVLLRRPFDPLERDEAPYVRWATEEAERWQRSGRAPTTEAALAFLFTYSALRDRARSAPPMEVPEHGPRWERVLAAACALRHRQRAAVILRYCAALDDEEIAAVLGVRANEAPAIVDAAVAAIVRTLGDRVDVRRGLRMAAGRLRQRLAEDRERGRWERPLYPLETAPARDEPREVIRAWITAPVTNEVSLRRRIAAAWSPPPAIPSGSPVFTLLAGSREESSSVSPAEATPPAPVRPPARPAVPVRPVAGPGRWRAALAVAAALVVAAVIAPVAAGPDAVPDPVPLVEPVSVGPPAAERVVAPPAVTVAGRTFVRVARGDTLWALAGDAFGDPMRWVDIWRANRGRRMAGGERFTDPNLIKPGWALRVPARGGSG